MLIQFAYDFSTAILEPPSSNQVRLDASAPYALAARAWARNLTTDGRDVHTFLMSTPIGSRLYLQDRNDHALFVELETVAAAIDRVDYVELPVTWIGSGGALLNNQAIEFTVITAEAPGEPIPPPGSGPVLVAFEVAKRHLRITDNDHDAEIQSKLEIASAEIVNYLKAQADPAWDATTAPLDIQGATLKRLGAIYEHRGDDGSSADEDKNWDEIGRILMRRRDPALA